MEAKPQDEEIRNDSDSNFHFFLHKFENEVHLNKTNHAKLCIQANYLFLHDKSGNLVLIRLDLKDVSGNVVQNVKGFSQVLNSSPSDVGGCYEFYVVTDSWQLVGYEVTDKTVQSVSTIDINSLLAEGEEVEFADISASFEDYVVLCVNNKHIVSLSTKDKQFKKVCDVELNVLQSGVKTYCIVGNTCVVLQQAKVILIYSLLDGELLHQVNIDYLKIDEDSIQIWAVSFDSNKLIFVLQNGSLQIIDLLLQGQQTGRTSLLTDSRRPDRSINTVKYGDRAWKERVSNMHARQASASSLHKTQILPSNQAKARSVGPKRRVTGFKSRGSETGCLGVSSIPAPDGIEGYSVEDLCIDPTCLSAVYTYNDVSILCQWVFKDERWAKFRFKPHQRVMLSELPSLPHTVLTARHLLCVITNCEMGQEEFVNELMVYGGASLADKVCHINKWGRCTIPLNTLDNGLKHRQIDTVSFFLKSKENFFSSSKTIPVSPQSPRESPSWTSHYSHMDHLLQLDPAFNLLLQNVRDSMGDKHAQIFGRQVLDITMDFLYGLLMDGLDVAEKLSEPREKEDLKKATEKLLVYIEEARSCVRQFEEKINRSISRTGSVSADSISGTSLSAVSEDIVSYGGEPEKCISEETIQSWDRMDIETVIEEGIMTNQIPTLQHYLHYRGDHSKRMFIHIKSAGLRFAVNYIQHDNMEKAKELFLKLGLNVTDKLWEIALHSLDTKLCTSITDELLRMSVLTKQQVSMVTFLKDIQELYPRRDFETLKGQHQHVKDSESHEVHRVKALINPLPVIDLTEECGNLSDQYADHDRDDPWSESKNYSEVMLQWIADWDETTRDWIKLDVVLHKIGSDISIFKLDVIWDYMQMYNMSKVMIAWIHKSFHDNSCQATTTEQADWPVSHLGAIPEAFVDRTDLCTDFTRTRLLKAFAKNGVFNQEAHNDFETLLKHLNWAGGVLRKPHPLTKCTSINLEGFHMSLIHHCVQCNLADFLWIYCNIHRLNVSLLHTASHEVEQDSWLPVFTHFYAVSQERNEWRKAMLECSLMNAAMVWGPEVAGVGELLQAGHVMTAMATLMYSPHQLHQVTFVTQQLEAFDGLCSETVERAVKMYPKLHVTLFPASTTDSPHTDVSVYQLLQGNSPFDPTRLFGWQSTNTCRGEDASKEMPYFSNTNLVSQFGYVEHLRYTYYLKQGRPSFAYISFLAEEFKNGGPTLSSKRFSVAMGTSMCIGVKHFNHPHISSSCVMFQELLGHDSLLLRTYIQVGNEILTYKNNAVTGPMDKRRELTKHNESEVVDMLLSSLQSIKRFTPDVLQALEASILAGITKDRLLSTSFESGQRWIVAVLFCHLVGLPYTTVFLESCAQTNQWLPFIWFSQIHQYSKEQLLGLLHHFKSPHLQEHLRYVIVNASNRCTLEAQKKSTKKRADLTAKDVRMTLYTKIGVKDKDSDMSTTSDEEEPTSFPIQQQADSDDDFEFQITYDGCPSDVFGVVFAAQTSKCPWKSMLVYSLTMRNPLFAELAACLQDAKTLHCLCSWLVAMMNVTEHAQFVENHGKLSWRYHLEHLDKIIDIYITNKWGSLLVTGFDIFQQNSPLLPFLQFYAEFTERKDFSKCRLYLNEFKQSFFQFHNERPVKSSLVIGDSTWLERMTFRIIQYLLTNTNSMYEVTELLKMLDSESITLVFKTEDPDYRKQYKLMCCLQTADVRSVSFRRLLSGQDDESRQECQRVTSLLSDRQLFDEARQFAGIAGLSADHVTLAQMLNQKELLSVSELWNSKQARMKFYKHCIEMATKYAVSSYEITQFFLKETDQLDNASERSQLLEMCLAYMDQDVTVSENNEAWTDIYRQMWTNKVQEQLETDQNQGIPSIETDSWSNEQTPIAMSDKKTKQELLCVGKMPSSMAKPTDLNTEETKALLKLVGSLLKEGKISECCRVTSTFDVYSQDLALTLTFIRLSLGVMDMENLTREMLHLLRTPQGHIHRQSIMAPVALLRNSSTISLMSNIQPMIESVTEENEQKISTMEVLLNHCEHSKNTCIRILTAFKIALVLEMGYDDVVTGDDYVILGSLLKTTCTAKFRLAADFLRTSSLSTEEVAGFLSDAILRSFRISLGQRSGGHDLVFDPGENFGDFHQIIRLCKNPSILGQRLVDTIASMSVEVEDVTDKVLTLQTEVLILAHDCYTASCDMEGISNILRAARILTAHLEAAHEFQLMTRLLTGVGRYNEMIYIFDSLKQNHQFELLLGKGMEKESKLKTSILDYLKRYHPGDSETYTMVALKFMMYREIAQLLHDNANKILDKLKSKPLENNNDTQALLQKVAQYYAEAAESFIKDSCLRQAQTCVRRARLVALQLKNLSSNQQYINLTVKGANLLIADHPVFSEAYIISEAYQQREAWAAALCNNVIVRGDMKYLQEFRSHIRIKPQLIEDAVEKYQQSPSKSPQATSNVKKLLPLCKDIKLQYRIAKSLGLREIVMDLEKGEAKSYIMDFTALQG